ncbi:MAG: DUF1820 family protein [Proteobacteria bacterium]|nr:DUF1820 family protein [Pseudomonadota bacterium]MBS0464117.1 DUF1820 family protein [Pseudomonadota bacterium]
MPRTSLPAQVSLTLLAMSNRKLYKISFLSAGRIYELYARKVASSELWGFTEISEVEFEVGAGVVVDPTEERLRDEFGATKRLHLPMQSILRIEEVERRGVARIRDAASGEAAVTPFPIPSKGR